MKRSTSTVTNTSSRCYTFQLPPFHPGSHYTLVLAVLPTGGLSEVTWSSGVFRAMVDVCADVDYFAFSLLLFLLSHFHTCYWSLSLSLSGPVARILVNTPWPGGSSSEGSAGFQQGYSPLRRLHSAPPHSRHSWMASTGSSGCALVPRAPQRSACEHEQTDTHTPITHTCTHTSQPIPDEGWHME